MDKRGMTRRSMAIVIATMPWVLASCSDEERVPVLVYKDPTCGCCTAWVKHLEASGFTADVRNDVDVGQIKASLGVPGDLTSCHTAKVGDYVIEGHVPAVAIKRLLVEHPDALGLAVPGMPIGSPGMEGENPEPYEVVMFAKDTRRSYMRFIGARAVT